MKRRRAREYALQILFQLEMSHRELNHSLLDEFWEGKKVEHEVKEFTHDIVMNSLKHTSEIDDLIKRAAEHWAIDRMAVIDRSILRAATYELAFRADIPHTVTINEALEIAKKFSTEESAPFINGILDKVAQLVSAHTGNKS